MNNDISSMRSFTDNDGILTYIDPMTRKTKKNRIRHIKDGAPKSERGKSHAEQAERIIYELSGHMVIR